MYRSRVRLENDLVSMAFDSATGELIELVNMRNGDNLLKNWSGLRSMPLSIELDLAGGHREVLTPARQNLLLKNSHLKPEILLHESDDGKQSISVSYKGLVADDNVRNIGVTYTAELEPGNCEVLWKIYVENGEPDSVVSSVNFPCVFGIYLGESWKDDELVYPFNSGERIKNPVEVYEKSPNAIGWKWQEYKYIYFMDGIDTREDEDGAFFREFKYSGPLSMMWLDYYDEEQGIYIACYDDGFAVGGLRAETFGSKRPGMGFAAIKYPEIKYGEAWESPYLGMAIHKGDWHWGADRYREWRESCSYAMEPTLPKWFRESPGMVAHYDFKYQGGGIVHRFSDIPRLYDEAREMGLNHILISGWHRDGFDNGFPQYTIDPDLGTEEELIRGIEHVRNLGGHVTFYINSQLCNTKYDDMQGLIDEAGVKGLDGEVQTAGYGDSESIEFAIMCSGAKAWQEHLKDTVSYLVDVIGIDGIYLDQLGMAPPQFCHDGRHRHHIAAWNHGYRQLLSDIIETFEDRYVDEDEKPVIFYEGVTDVHGSYVSGQLISTFIHYHTGAYPELYRYTFPDQILIDMVYPHRGLAMRPVHVGQASRAMINKAFAIGTYLWIYDLEEDNTFKRDPEQLEHLRRVIDLRRVWLELYGHGIFKDIVGVDVSHPSIMAKLYNLEDGSRLVAINNIDRLARESIRVDCTDLNVKEVIWHSLYEPESPIYMNWKIVVEGKERYVELGLKDCELGLIHIETINLRGEIL